VVWKEVMMRAQSKGGRSYGNFTSYAPENGFDDLLSRILSDNLDEGAGNDDGGWFSNLFGGSVPPSQRDAPKEEYTPLGRHQYDLND